ncbi:hypothetical protein Trydic_g9288 [Trypoxylus dichotomus]
MVDRPANGPMPPPPPPVETTVGRETNAADLSFVLQSLANESPDVRVVLESFPSGVRTSSSSGIVRCIRRRRGGRFSYLFGPFARKLTANRVEKGSHSMVL